MPTAVAQVCGDSLDNNCDGQVDEGCCSAALLDNFEDGTLNAWVFSTTLQSTLCAAPTLVSSLTLPQRSAARCRRVGWLPLRKPAVAPRTTACTARPLAARL